jgi:hypothetical protein
MCLKRIGSKVYIRQLCGEANEMVLCDLGLCTVEDRDNKSASFPHTIVRKRRPNEEGERSRDLISGFKYFPSATEDT